MWVQFTTFQHYFFFWYNKKRIWPYHIVMSWLFRRLSRLKSWGDEEKVGNRKMSIWDSKRIDFIWALRKSIRIRLSGIIFLFLFLNYCPLCPRWKITNHSFFFSLTMGIFISLFFYKTWLHINALICKLVCLKIIKLYLNILIIYL